MIPTVCLAAYNNITTLTVINCWVYHTDQHTVEPLRYGHCFSNLKFERIGGEIVTLSVHKYNVTMQTSFESRYLKPSRRRVALLNGHLRFKARRL